MHLKRDKMSELMNVYCNGNYSCFARELGVDPSHIYRFILNGVGGGKKIIGGVLSFCKERNIKFEEYIEL